ncbi:18 kDa heat shock protein [[Clostridium] ultunense Esp]|uniref:18 kDa heat shock protein n=1 Tax=[Clostridium] ultunense Esp TaxID=1288971 RepID=M1YVC9_9FIRM|nr:Hsp20/alpha crystallin family protein [Schnuerera ultunensis]CCQ94520.1 18 kDa heat shock protein [[Clostridium] ultunense Esp]SHD76056.1 18 kDa heat shock protein [[Clostridium] ultunense Esp]
MFGITPYRGRSRGLSRRWGWDFDRMFEAMLEEFDDNTFSYYPMKVDIKERDKEYILEAELPGANKDNIILEIKDDILTISVERKEELNEEKENYIRRERRYGSFRRNFYVEGVNQEKIKAKFDNGVLRVKLPKKEGTPPRENRIPIE